MKHDLWEASVAVPEQDYNELIYPILPKTRTSPYYCAFIAMVTAFSGLYRWSGSNETVDFVFDQQVGMQTKAARQYYFFRKLHPHWRLGRVAFADEKNVLPLQAADLVAWQTRRFMCSKEGTRKELKRLHSAKPPFRTTVKRALLQQMADAIRKNIPNLRQEEGDEKIDRFLAAIERRNRAEQEKEHSVEKDRN